jgi:hypothetical protein
VSQESRLLAKRPLVKRPHPCGLLARDGTLAEYLLRKRGLFAHLILALGLANIYVPFVDPTEASYMPSNAGVVENARRPVAVHRKSDLSRRRSGPSETIMSLIRLAQWGGDGARRRIESATLGSVMSRGTPSTTALLRASMERPDSVAAGQLPASGDTEESTGRRAVSGRSVSPGFNGPTPTGRPAAPPGGVGGRGRSPAPRRGTRSWACGCGAGRVARRAPGRRSGRGSG